MTTHAIQSTDPGHGLTVADAMEPCEYQITADSTVGQADDVLRSAHLAYLLVRDHNGRCAGLVTRKALHPFLARSWYTEGTLVGDAMRQRGPFAWPAMALAMAALAMRIKRLAVWPVIDDDGYILGIITADHVTDMVGVATPAGAQGA